MKVARACTCRESKGEPRKHRQLGRWSKETVRSQQLELSRPELNGGMPFSPILSGLFGMPLSDQPSSWECCDQKPKRAWFRKRIEHGRLGAGGLGCTAPREDRDDDWRDEYGSNRW